MRDTDLLKSQKKWLRESALQQRSAMPMENISQAIRENLLAWPLFRQAQRILFYYPFRGEVDLLPLALQKADTPFYLPKVSKQSLYFLRYEPTEPLQNGKFGIPEPGAQAEAYGQPTPGDVLLAPGLMFDCAGYRLGYGQGFYDRFLATLAENCVEAPVVGVTPASLIVETLPREPWDLPMTYLATEDGIVSTQ